MNKQFTEDLKARFSELLSHSPAKDIERNAKEMIKGAMARMDMVTREEFNAQREFVITLSEKIQALEARINELEGKGAPTTPPTDTN